MDVGLQAQTKPSISNLVIRGLVLVIAQIPLLRASPLVNRAFSETAIEAEAGDVQGVTLWIYLAVAVALVLLGGAFAGLTIALMGQDEIYLQVIKSSGEGSERLHAARVLRLLKRGKHWVLVTLLLSNVITNETLPIVLDRSLGGGWPAVLGSTVLIVIFGEVIPQSICVRYGLPIGAYMSPLVLILMYLLAPVAWPTAKLLDRLLGEDHGTTYKKAGLKTLVTLHKSLGAAGEQLNQDEVTIISAVLDLKAKPVGNIMTPMADVFTMSADTVLDEKTMEIILGAGYSRIPIHAPDNENNFVGMLLVKILITYDPEDCKRVRDFALATLPETRSETSCLDIVNFFQEGKSHMVLVSEYPGEDHGALGVVTLEDVIEELIGEEIIDESDVFIDVHKAIRRITPAPKSRVPKGEVVTDPDDTIADGEEHDIDPGNEGTQSQHTVHRTKTKDSQASHKPADAVSSAAADVPLPPRNEGAEHRTSGQPKNLNPELREHLRHLGPSNLASRPRTTRYNTVKIKPGHGSFGEEIKASSRPEPAHQGSPAAQGGVGAGIVNSAGRDAKDGVLAVQAGYGTMDAADSSLKISRSPFADSLTTRQTRPARSETNDRSRTASQSTIGSMHSGREGSFARAKGAVARSGSITENIIDAGGIKKTVLEMIGATDGNVENENNGNTLTSTSGNTSVENGQSHNHSGSDRSKQRRRRKKANRPGNQSQDGIADENQPLLR